MVVFLELMILEMCFILLIEANTNPIRKLARAKAFEKVLVIIIFSYFNTKDFAVIPENSIYASSIKKIEFGKRIISFSKKSIECEYPVGLFGLQIYTRLGFKLKISLIKFSESKEKSSL